MRPHELALLGLAGFIVGAMLMANWIKDRRANAMADANTTTKPIFRPGDVVRLKSGGPNLTVVLVTGGIGSAREILAVEWFNPVHGKIDASRICAVGAELISTDETRKAAQEKMDAALKEMTENMRQTGRSKPLTWGDFPEVFDRSPSMDELKEAGRPDPHAELLKAARGGKLAGAIPPSRKVDVAGTMDEPFDAFATGVKLGAAERAERANTIPVSDELANSPLVKRAAMDAEEPMETPVPAYSLEDYNRRALAWRELRDASSPRLANAVQRMIAAYRPSE